MGLNKKEIETYRLWWLPDFQRRCVPLFVDVLDPDGRLGFWAYLKHPLCDDTYSR